MFDLKRFRKDKGIAQKAIIDLLKKDQSIISRIENYDRKLPKGDFDILLKEYGEVVKSYIIEDEPKKNVKQELIELRLTVKMLREQMESQKAHFDKILGEKDHKIEELLTRKVKAS